MHHISAQVCFHACMHSSVRAMAAPSRGAKRSRSEAPLLTRNRHAEPFHGPLLRELLHSGTTASHQICKILQKLKAVDQLNAEIPSQSTLSRRTAELLLPMLHTERMPLENGKTFVWEMCEPNLLLAYYVNSCESFRELFEAAIRRHPCSADSPWSLVVAFDEFSPGRSPYKTNSKSDR